MAGRTRYIKPDYFIDEKLAELPFESRIFFTGLWVYADREGRLKESQKKLKALIFPYDDVDLEKILGGLHEFGLIIRYQHDGEAFIQVSNFKKHQKIHPQEPESTLPAPNDSNVLKVPPTSSREVAHGLEYKYKYKYKKEGGAGGGLSGFEEFWNSYPKRVGKGAAERAWRNVKAQPAEIVAAVQAQAQSSQWKKDGGKYIPNPATWLNQKRWLDEIKPIAAAPQRDPYDPKGAFDYLDQ